MMGKKSFLFQTHSVLVDATLQAPRVLRNYGVDLLADAVGDWEIDYDGKEGKRWWKEEKEKKKETKSKERERDRDRERERKRERERERKGEKTHESVEQDSGLASLAPAITCFKSCNKCLRKRNALLNQKIFARSPFCSHLLSSNPNNCNGERRGNVINFEVKITLLTPKKTKNKKKKNREVCP